MHPPDFLLSPDCQLSACLEADAATAVEIATHDQKAICNA